MNKKFLVQEVMLEKKYFPIVEENEILKNALDKMNSFGYGIVCLINFKSELIGVITDGDIRRRLLSSQKPLSAMFIDDAIKHCIKSPITVSNNSKLKDAVDLMEKRKIWDLPVINENNHLIGLLHLHNAIKKLL